MPDESSLLAISNAFEQLLHRISQRVEDLSSRAQQAAEDSHERHMSTIVEPAHKTAERAKEILAAADELEQELAKIRTIGEIVHGFKRRIARLEQELGIR